MREQSAIEIYLAAQLHDGVGQLLSAALMHLEPLLNQGGDGEETARTVSTLIEEAIARTRSLTKELCPPVLYQEGLPCAVDWLAEEMLRLHGLRVEVLQVCAMPVMHHNALALLFAAVRELLMNVVKHARVRSATVTLGASDGAPFIVVKDRGVGFDTTSMQVDDAGSGFGLFHIRHRVEEMGGMIVIRSSHGNGAEIRMTLPTSEISSVVKC